MITRPMLLLVLLLGPASLAADELAPFTTDGCSLFPDGDHGNRHLWLQCCIAHDLAYWMGGTEQQRLAADEQLQTCVADQGKPDVARLMLGGVRVGGGPQWPTPYRWAYGWTPHRDYQPLNDADIAQIKNRLQELEQLIHTSLEKLRTAPETGTTRDPQ